MTFARLSGHEPENEKKSSSKRRLFKRRDVYQEETDPPQPLPRPRIDIDFMKIPNFAPDRSPVLSNPLQMRQPGGQTQAKPTIAQGNDKRVIQYATVLQRATWDECNQNLKKGHYSLPPYLYHAKTLERAATAGVITANLECHSSGDSGDTRKFLCASASPTGTATLGSQATDVTFRIDTTGVNKNDWAKYGAGKEEWRGIVAVPLTSVKFTPRLNVNPNGTLKKGSWWDSTSTNPKGGSNRLSDLKAGKRTWKD